MNYTFVKKDNKRYYFRSENCKDEYDLSVPENILVISEKNYDSIIALLPSEHQDRIRLLKENYKYRNALKKISHSENAYINQGKCLNISVMSQILPLMLCAKER